MLWTVSLAPARAGARPLGTDRDAAVRDLYVRGTIRSGWHIYAVDQGPGGPVPTRITLPEGQPFKVAGTVTPISRPETAMDASFGLQVSMHRDSAVFRVPVRLIAPGAAARNGMDSVRVAIRYQACNATTCMPPRTVTVAAASGALTPGPSA